MKLKSLTDRQYVDVVIVSIVAIIMAQLSLSVDFVGCVASLAQRYGSTGAVRFLGYFMFLLLTGFLWVTYRRWRNARSREAELERVVESIIPDAILVLSPTRIVVACNTSVKKMFGYERKEVIGTSADTLYTEHRSQVGILSDAYRAMEEGEGFLVCLATGKKKNGDTFALEMVTGLLKGDLGAVVLLHSIPQSR